MGIVNFSAAAPHTAAATSPVVRAMNIGQYVISTALTAIGALRAIGDGIHPAVSIACGVALLTWHLGGAALLTRVGARSAPVWWLLGFAGVWITTVIISAEFVWVAFLLWLLAGHLLPGVAAAGFSLAVYGVVAFAPIVHHGGTSYANVFGPLIGGVFAFGISRGYLELLRDAAERERLVVSLTQAQQEMADLQDELAFTQRHSGAIAERTRLSRDIHDTIAQALSSIRLLAHASGEGNAEPTSTLRQIETLAGDSLGDVRRIIAELAPAELDRGGFGAGGGGEPGGGGGEPLSDDALAAALQRLLDRLREQTGIHGTLNADVPRPLLPPNVEVALLRTAQSALANVRLHAGASLVVMSLIDDGDAVRLDIIDDGRGFDATAWEADAAQGGGSSGYGLGFMRSRLRELGGDLEVESVPGEGTALSAHLPIHLASRRPGVYLPRAAALARVDAASGAASDLAPDLGAGFAPGVDPVSAQRDPDDAP